MNASPVFKWRKALARILALFARPVREAPARGGVSIGANRGYGSRTEIFCIGRVFEQSPPSEHGADGPSIFNQLRDIRRRISRRALPNIVVTARFYGTEEDVTTDRDGYFQIHLQPRLAPPANVLWHTLDVSVKHPPTRRTHEKFLCHPTRSALHDQRHR